MIHERFLDLFSGPGNDQFREEKRRCVQEADAVICISETTLQDVLRFYKLDSNSTYVVPLACSDFFRQINQRGDHSETLTKQPFLLYVGSRAHYKNFDRLIHAYSVWGDRKKVALVVVGSPWSADEELRLAELGILDCVHLLTDVDDEELCQLYNQAAAFVYPSLYEGFGIPLLEAMACGCPVIASHVPSTIEVAGECPIYFEPMEVDELVNAFDVALSEGRDSERTEVGLERVKQYSWAKTAAQTLEVYRKISER
jgi:glycosyltransferase involved in cell wall biosynthesis